MGRPLQNWASPTVPRPPRSSCSHPGAREEVDRSVPRSADRPRWRRVRSPSARPDWRELLLLAAFIAVGVGRIVATYRQLSATFDEPVHLESGIEWLQYGRLTYNQMHPPLSRAFIAAGPYLDGVRWQGRPDWQTEGIAELHARRDYWRTLALARAGVLPFFVLAVVGTWWLARRIFGREVALISAGALTMVPPVLGHAGLATTDLPVAALMPVVIAAGITWLERPTRGATLALGAACGIAVLLKFSALVFVPASLIAMVLLKAALEPRRASRPPVPGYSYGGPMLGVLLTAFLVLWAGYRFHVGSLDSIQLGGLRLGAFVPPAVARAPVVPAPEFWTGLLIVLWYNRLSIPAYVLGEVVPGGTWYFFPLALGVKTPLAFLVLMVVGLVVTAYVAWRHRLWMTAIPLATALAVLTAGMTNRIALGLRHLLAIYPMLAIMAGVGGLSLWHLRTGRRLGRLAIGRVASGVLAAWLIASSLAAHPDYLSYFNEVASSRPEHFLLNSDLDYGQDVGRLADTLRARGIDSVTVYLFAFRDDLLLSGPEPRGLSRLAVGPAAAGDWLGGGELAAAARDSGHPVAPGPAAGRTHRHLHRPVLPATRRSTAA